MTSIQNKPASLLVLGLGNVLCRDDGLGVVAVARILDGWHLPERAALVDGGTLGLSLLPLFEEAEAVILVDAIREDAPPGSFVRLDGEDVAPAVAERLSVHQVGVADLLDAARWRGRYPPSVLLLGLVPESIELGLGCSQAVEAAMPQLIDRVVEEARALGFDFRPRGRDEVLVRAGRGDGAHALGL